MSPGWPRGPASSLALLLVALSFCATLHHGHAQRWEASYGVLAWHATPALPGAPRRALQDRAGSVPGASAATERAAPPRQPAAAATMRAPGAAHAPLPGLRALTGAPAPGGVPGRAPVRATSAPQLLSTERARNREGAAPAPAAGAREVARPAHTAAVADGPSPERQPPVHPAAPAAHAQGPERGVQGLEAASRPGAASAPGAARPRPASAGPRLDSLGPRAGGPPVVSLQAQSPRFAAATGAVRERSGAATAPEPEQRPARAAPGPRERIASGLGQAPALSPAARAARGGAHAPAAERGGSELRPAPAPRALGPAARLPGVETLRGSVAAGAAASAAAHAARAAAPAPAGGSQGGARAAWLQAPHLDTRPVLSNGTRAAAVTAGASAGVGAAAAAADAPRAATSQLRADGVRAGSRMVAAVSAPGGSLVILGTGGAPRPAPALVVAAAGAVAPAAPADNGTLRALWHPAAEAPAVALGAGKGVVLQFLVAFVGAGIPGTGQATCP